MKNNSSDKYFETSDFYLAVFLLAKKFELMGINDLDPKRSIFLFSHSQEIGILAEQFLCAKENSLETLVDVRLIVIAIRRLKGILFQRKEVCRED